LPAKGREKARKKEVYEKTVKLLVLEGVDVLVAFVDLRMLEIIKPLLYASGKLVLVVNPGANYPENWVPQSNIVSLTLQHGFLCWLTGKLSAKMNNAHAAMATTFYDCGYLHSAAMVKGFVKGGGSITYNYINNQRYDDAFEINPLTDFLSADKTTNCLLCIFDSFPASLFYSRLNTYEAAGNLHLFVSPMMLEQAALENIAGGFTFPIDGYIPWHSAAENNANKEFIEIYQLQAKRTASIFSLLGWETGLVMHQVFLNSNENYADGTAIVGKLATEIINSPRGEMKIDPETNYFIAPVYKCSVPQHSGNLSIEYTDTPEDEWKAFVEMPTEGVSSGWTNTYLCY